MNDSERRLYGERVALALSFAADTHATQSRKGKKEPYLSHILMVAALVAHYGGDEEQIMAGALHDAVEDQGGEQMALDIEARFGTRAAQIVRECSDAVPAPGEPKPPWRPRKEAFLQRVRTQPDRHGAHLVEACDKHANLRDIVEDVQAHGAGALKDFSGTPDEVLWYYEQLGEALMPGMPMETEYRRLLAVLREAVQG